ncbi:MAG TPA: hypothetical protein VG839_04230 [Asticcacaulis sp.]|nr:hypothetical protein [Asticcacaulis sp.]
MFDHNQSHTDADLSWAVFEEDCRAHLDEQIEVYHSNDEQNESEND